jgi:CheY-like chemotaxis protein
MSWAHGEHGDAAGTIVVVDDDELSRYVVARRLLRWGFEPVVFERADAVLAYLREVEPWALISDLEMPELDGLALARSVRQLRPAMPIILLTANQDRDLEAKARDAGVNRILGKQAGVDRELRAALEGLLGGQKTPTHSDFELAHALRTPLTALKSAIDLLSDEELPESQQRFAGIAQRNVDQMIVLVERLLAPGATRP